MSDDIIKVEGLGKKYILSHVPGERYTALREVISRKAKGLVGKKENILPAREEFWALKDISFGIKKGEAVGIIGRNGAGKSTLLKILSRITEPSLGRITLNGRVASLLEVGTGFHPELTGRENIFLNGAILGMSRAEIKQKFDTIVDFSGVEKFLDTPVKRYSSGMYVRLAFAIAAHLEPEILVIDEVLAVGDAEFQKKCLGKMDEVSRKEGRTVLFVSHNMEAVQRFCSRSILLQNGQLVEAGPTKEVLDIYQRQYVTTCEKYTWDVQNAPADSHVKLHAAWMHDEQDRIKPDFSVAEKIGISFEYEVLTEGTFFTHGVNIYNSNGVNIFNAHDVVSTLAKQRREKGKYKATAWLPAHLLPDEIFSVGIALFSPNPLYQHVHQHHVLTFRTYDNGEVLTARGNYTGSDFGGLVRPLLHWDAVSIK
jgi:lipopolysaccharide transport system ATP-binding protein